MWISKGENKVELMVVERWRGDDAGLWRTVTDGGLEVQYLCGLVMHFQAGVSGTRDSPWKIIGRPDTIR